MDPGLDNAPCGFIRFDDAGQVQAINQTLARWLGMSVDDVVGQPLSGLLAPGGAIFHQTHFFPLLKLHGEVGEIYLPLLTRGGNKLPMIVSAIRRETGEGARNDCVLLPMYQRHQFEEELIKARRAAEQARDAKARFLSMLAHEVRSPLSSITGLADVMNRGLHGPVTDDQRQDIEMMLAAGRDIDQLIREILAFSRAEAGHEPSSNHPILLQPVLDRVEALMGSQWEQAGIHYRRAPCEDQSVVIADAMHLQQVLLNLLSNAAKFTPPGGSVSLHCIRESEPPKIRIEVRDSGCGIPTDQLDAIFEPFVQVSNAQHPQKRGTGLGLAISRQLASGMHGRLHAESVPGKGATFVLVLPAVAGNAGRRPDPQRM